MVKLETKVWNESQEEGKILTIELDKDAGDIFRIRQEILSVNAIAIYEWDVLRHPEYLKGLPEFERKRAEESQARVLLGRIGIIWYCIKCKKGGKWPDCVPGRDKCEHELVIKSIQPWEEGK